MLGLTISEAFHRYVKALSVALHERDRYTRMHCDRVNALSHELGVACGLSPLELEALRHACTLHDVGKIGIPDSVLFKPGRLDADEWEVIKTHSARGERIVCAMELPDARKVGEIIRCHHEHFDGHGYPDGLSGENIPVESRILAIADSYDAMATTRSYHRARKHEDIMQIMHAETGAKNDPSLFRKFADVIEKSPCRAA